MKLCFDSIEEVKEFVTQLKGTRGGKGKDKDEGGDEAPATNVAQPTAVNQAPQPLQPPAAGEGFPGTGGPAPGAAGFTPPGGASPFPAASAPVLVPEIAGLVNRISTRIDSAISGGQPAETVLAWFKGQCGPEAANATMDQIKTVFLPKAAQPTLENIAKLMNA